MNIQHFHVALGDNSRHTTAMAVMSLLDLLIYVQCFVIYVFFLKGVVL